MGSAYVLVVEPETTVTSSTAALFQQAGLETQSATTGADTLALSRQMQPALVLLDVALPDVDGLEVLYELRETFGDALPIILTATDRTETHDRIAGFLIGADDYLARPCDPAELLARVRRLLIRDHPTHSAPDDETPNETFGLTQRELQVLQRLAVGFAPAEIAAEFTISPKTVASHLQRALAKMHVHSRIQAIALAHAYGLVTPLDVEPQTGARG
jgi:DNA-binding NarL/FixJ family response regulator